MAPARRWIWRVIVGSGHARGEILAGHAAADDVGELESDGIDLAQRLGIGTVRAAIVVGALFRRLFVTRLLDLHGAGKLVFFGKLAGLGDRCVFLRHLAQVRRKRWVVCQTALRRA